MHKSRTPDQLDSGHPHPRNLLPRLMPFGGRSDFDIFEESDELEAQIIETSHRETAPRSKEELAIIDAMSALAFETLGLLSPATDTEPDLDLNWS